MSKHRDVLLNSNHRSKNKSGNLISWIILIFFTILITSFFSTNQHSKSPANQPSSSINNQILGETDEKLAEKQKTTSPIATDKPENPTDDTNNAVGKPSPTPTDNSSNTISSLDKLDLTIKLLNGSGNSASFGKAQADLESNGYVIAITDNAKNSYLKTTIYYQKDQKNQAAELAQTISINPVVEQNDTIAKDYNLVVVIGADYAH